jgi:hypothetical protein
MKDVHQLFFLLFSGDEVFVRHPPFFMCVVYIPLHAQKILEITDQVTQKMEWYAAKNKPSGSLCSF